MEVTGQDSTLYLLAAKLIILQTFHYMNQTTASSSLASSFSFYKKTTFKKDGEREREREREKERERERRRKRHPTCDLPIGPV